MLLGLGLQYHIDSPPKCLLTELQTQACGFYFQQLMAFGCTRTWWKVRHVGGLSSTSHVS